MRRPPPSVAPASGSTTRSARPPRSSAGSTTCVIRPSATGCEYEAACRRAVSARFALVIQREAIGLRHHAVVEQLFPEPPRRFRRRTASSPP